MSWREMLLMDQRSQFVLDYRSGVFTMTELAMQYGISRKTGYKWVNRYDEADGTLRIVVEGEAYSNADPANEARLAADHVPH